MKTTFALGLVLALGCGGGAKPDTWKPAQHDKSERTVDHWTTADEDRYIGLACTNIVAPDHTLRCPTLVKAGLTPERCRGLLADWRTNTPDGPKRQAFRLLVAGLAVADSCETVDATFVLAARAASPDDTAAAAAAGCPRRADNALDLTAEQAAARHGFHDKRFTDTTSSAEKPIEVCGIMGEVEWLTRVTCADGSRPWGDDIDRAHAARHGSLIREDLSPCKTTPVDHYTAPCPEKSYEVYMDLYMCGPGEDLSRGLVAP